MLASEQKVYRHYTGFSLAEVLVTLVIVGIIAALVIPSIVYNTKDMELRNKWKKVYSDVSRATMLLKTLNGDIDFSSDTSFLTDYSKVMSFMKEGNFADFGGSYYRYYKNFSVGTSGIDGPAAVLNDGVVMLFKGIGGVDNSCSTQIGDLKNICAYSYIDVNGSQKPNMYGKDLFFIWIVKENNAFNTYAAGSHGDNYSCSENSSDGTTSAGCSAYFLYHETGI